MKHIENIVIGKPLVEPSVIFAKDNDDWDNLEKEQTMWTEERTIAAVLKELGIVKSIGEVRRNKPHFCERLESPDFIEVKWGKNRLFVLVGE